MKIPFSYRTAFFPRFLSVSIIGHVLFFGAGSGVFVASPRFAVERAPISVEVVILREPKIQEEKKRPVKILFADESPSKIPVSRKIEESKRETLKTLYTPPARGALHQDRPDAFKNRSPIYPEFARSQGWEGLVLLRAFIRKDGRPSEVLLDRSSGYKILDKVAVEAVLNWQFLPARAGRLTFSTWVRIPVRFSLDKQVKS